MAWTTPKTWTVDEVVGASDMNTHLRDNLVALKDPPSAIYDGGTLTHTTTSSTFADVDAVNLKLSVTITGDTVLIGFVGECSSVSSASILGLDITVNGVSVTGGAGVIREHYLPTNETQNVSSVWRETGLVAGKKEFRLQFRRPVLSGTVKLYSTQFWVAEVS